MASTTAWLVALCTIRHSIVYRPVPDMVFYLVFRVHPRFHIEIMHLPPPRWPGGRSWLTEGAGSVHQRPDEPLSASMTLMTTHHRLLTARRADLVLLRPSRAPYHRRLDLELLRSGSILAHRLPRLGLMSLLLALFAIFAPIDASAQQTTAKLQPGFAAEVLVEGLLRPTSMAWAPDQHLWIGGKNGEVWTLHAEDLQASELVTIGRIQVDTGGERGLSGIAVDPDYSENRHIWIYYTTPRSPYRNRLSRFRHVGRQLVNETVMLESPVLGSQIHNGGCLRFASDKTLFVSTGDDRQGNSTAQDTHDLRGKILHINRDGSPAAGNPYLDGEKGDPRVWAYGFRNPWRFNLQPESENLFIGDVGEGRWEELNLGFRGGNFGWQLTEGPDPPGVPGVRYPIYSYPHTSPLGHAITGGDHARANNFPEEYKGNYFFGDSSTNELFRMVLGETNAPVLTEVFASEALRPVDIQFGPDGALYYVSFNGSVVRISYVGGTNRQPTALARVTPDNGEAPLTVSFDASGSTDADGDALTFRWDLGNGEQSSESILQRTYPPGVYNVSLTVTDSGGLSSSVQTSRVVSGNARPSAITQEPAHGRLYDDGEVIAFSGTGIDPEEGLIPCERLTWTVILHHLGHTHPFLGPLSGTCEGSFQVEPHGESHTFYEIRLSVDDTGASLGESGILTGVASVRIYPRLGWGSSR